MATADWPKMWARIQEGLLDLIDHATALQQMMDRNPTATINPARKAMSDALDRRITRARKEIHDLEKEMPESDRALLHAELEEIRRIRKSKAT